MTVAFLEIGQLGLLAVPKDAQGHEAHQPGDDLRGQGHQGPSQIPFGMDGLRYRRFQVQHQQGHGKGENPVADRRQPLQALPGDLVVGFFELLNCHFNGLSAADDFLRTGSLKILFTVIFNKNSR